MRLGPTALVLLAGAFVSPVARADGVEPLRVAVNCQTQLSISVCDFVEGYLGSTDGLRLVERSHADLMLYLNVTSSGMTEAIHLSVESLVELGPPTFEIEQPVNSRQDVEVLQEKVAELTLAALSPYLLQLRPGGLMISIRELGEVDDSEVSTSPYSFGINLGSRAYLTSGYKDIDIWGGVRLSKLHDDRSGYISWNTGAGWLRQPPLVIEGVEYSLDSDTTAMNVEACYVRDLDARWSLGGWVGGGMEDQEQRFERTGRVHMGIERNWFPSNDPKNNRFAIAYLVGAQADRYHQVNVYGETEAIFPKQLLLASGTVRKGRMDYSFGMDMISEIPDVLRQYQISGWTYSSMYLGDHVDLILWFNLTQQAIPGPAEVDQTNYEEISQGAYAEPLEMNGSISIRIHWDRSNGAMYNRFYSAARQGPLENL